MLHNPQRMGQTLARKPDEESAAASQPQSTALLSPFADPAEPILRHHGIDAESTEKIWDGFHDSRTSADLAKKLANYSEVPDAVKHDLFVAKQKTDPAPTWSDRVERAVEAIHKVAAMPSEHVETSEKHPKVLAAVMKIIGVGHQGGEE
jgi:hypothetical protein